jgi:two-component system, cell cycle sensor histidine kinase and response regulator CckA
MLPLRAVVVRGMHTSSIRLAVIGLLQLAASICGARFAVLRVDGREPIANDPAAPASFEGWHTVLLPGETFSIRGTLAVSASQCGEREAALLGQIAEQLLLIDEAAIIGAAVDVTARAQATRRIEEREEYFRALTENVSDVIAILQPDGRASYVSSSVRRILGYEPDELIGHAHFALIHPDDRDRVVAAFERLVTSSGPLVSETYRLQRKDGGWRVLESAGTNLLDHPQIRGLVVNTRDVTDRKLLEQELEQLNRLTSIGRLAAQIAHEFNNVLMGIQPLVELIRRQDGHNPQRMRIVDLVLASIARGKRITTDVLRFGRPAQPMLAAVDAEELADQAAEEIRSILPAGITLQVDAASGPMFMQADRAQLSQVLINLALNARDAMPKGGALTIGVRPGEHSDRRHRFIQLSVTDTGEGIAKDDLPYIFEPLFTTKQSGTGLGLSVVFQIVAAHRGHVMVESEPGQGTTFLVYIPSIAEQSEQVAPAIEPSLEIEQKLRVLIVEDDEAVAAGLQWSLEDAGVAVHVVATGAEVLPAVAAFRPDAIVLDLNLPDDDGRSVYRRVAAKFDVPVIFSTGHTREHEIESLLDGRRAAFLMKPYSTQVLLRTICEMRQAKEVTR